MLIRFLTCILPFVPYPNTSPDDGKTTINEGCFRQGGLRFAGDTSWVYYPGKGGAAARKVPFKTVKTTVGTTDWARIPIPGCKRIADPYTTCGARIPSSNPAWLKQGGCLAQADENSPPTSGTCAETQFPPPDTGVFGFALDSARTTFSIMVSGLIRY